MITIFSTRAWITIISVIGLLIIIIYYWLPEIVPSTHDTISFAGTDQEKGIIVDGTVRMSGSAFRNDDSRAMISAVTTNVLVDNYIPPSAPTPGSAPQTGELIAFTKGKIPLLKQNIPWTSGPDSISINFTGPLNVPVKFWVVTTTRSPDYDLSARQTRISAVDCRAASAIWREEGLGFTIQCPKPSNVGDATTAAVTYLDTDKSSQVAVFTTTTAASYFSSTPFSCLHVNNHPKMLKDSGSYVANRINVYYVESVEGENGEGGPDYGVVCTDHRDIIAIGRTTAATILAHELGHSFSLEHVDEYAKDCPSCTCDKPICPFDRLNVMYSKGPLARETLTEGQVFRAFYNADSVVNGMFGTGPGTGLDRPYCNKEMEQPPSLTNTAEYCPLLQKRLWPDDAMWGSSAWPTN